MSRMRTINNAVKYLKELDPDTQIRYNTIYNWIKSGALPAVKCGSIDSKHPTYLINMDVLEKFLEGESN